MGILIVIKIKEHQRLLGRDRVLFVTSGRKNGDDDNNDDNSINNNNDDDDEEEEEATSRRASRRRTRNCEDDWRSQNSHVLHHHFHSIPSQHHHHDGDDNHGEESEEEEAQRSDGVHGRAIRATRAISLERGRESAVSPPVSSQERCSCPIYFFFFSSDATPYIGLFVGPLVGQSIRRR